MLCYPWSAQVLKQVLVTTDQLDRSGCPLLIQCGGRVGAFVSWGSTGFACRMLRFRAAVSHTCSDEHVVDGLWYVYGGHTWLKPEVILATPWIQSDSCYCRRLKWGRCSWLEFTIKCSWLSKLKAKPLIPICCVCFLGDTNDGGVQSPD